jgi:hypothetical protein
VQRPADQSSEELASTALVVGSAALLLYLLWRSLRWPLIHDAALMHYIAWLIGQGAVPYRDTFDMNTPGVYLIHLAVLAVGGPDDVAWRVFERGWLAATVGLAYLYCRPMCDRRSAAMAGLLFAILHVGGGPSLAGQRDFLLCLFLLAGAYGVARSSERDANVRSLFGAGLVLGFGTMVKPLAGLFLVAGIGAASLARHRAGRSWLAGAAAVAGGGLVAPALIFGWLAGAGGLGDFFLILTRWTLPFYSQVGSGSPWRILVSLNWGLLAGAALLGAVRSAREPYGMRRGLAIVGVAYGLLHFGLQFKGYDYHLYPLALFLCVLCASALAPESRDAGGDRAGPGRYGRPLAIVLVAATVVVTGVRDVHRLNQPWEGYRVRRVNEAVADLQKLLPPGETVQVLGPPGGHILLRLRLRQPTRFFTDFQFYIPTQDPSIQALRSEFMAGLEARPPAAILAFPGNDPRDPFRRLADFPALSRFIEQRYAHAIEGNGYRIYTRRPGV